MCYGGNGGVYFEKSVVIVVLIKLWRYEKLLDCIMALSDSVYGYVTFILIKFTISKHFCFVLTNNV